MKYYSEKLKEAMMNGSKAPATLIPTKYLFDTKKELDEAEAAYDAKIEEENLRLEKEKKDREEKEAVKTARADEISNLAMRYNEMSREFFKDYGKSYLTCTTEFKERQRHNNNQDVEKEFSGREEEEENNEQSHNNNNNNNKDSSSRPYTLNDFLKDICFLRLL